MEALTHLRALLQEALQKDPKRFIELATTMPAEVREVLGDDDFRAMVTQAGDTMRGPTGAVEAQQIDLRAGAMEGVAKARTEDVSGKPAEKQPSRLANVLTTADIPGADRIAQLQGEELEAMSRAISEQEEAGRDESLRTMSKMKQLAADPEYVPPGIGAKLRPLTTAIPLVGPAMRFGQMLKENWEEPTVEQFHEDIKSHPELTLGALEGYDESSSLYKRYADLAWQEARKKAEAEGRPIYRVSQMPDVRRTLTRGFTRVAAPLALGAERGLVAGLPSEAIGRLDPSYAEARERSLEQSPGVATAGMVGSLVSPAGPMSIGGLAGRMATRGVSNLAPRLASSGLGAGIVRGGLEAGAGAAAESAGLSAADVVAGRASEPELAATRAGEAGVVGAAFGAPIGALRSLASAGRGSIRSGGSPHAQLLRDAREAGAETLVLSGIKPGPAVRQLNKRSASPQAALAEEIAPPMLRQAGRESEEYADLLRKAEGQALEGSRRMEEATKETIERAKQQYYKSSAGKKLHEIDELREAANDVVREFELSSGAAVAGRQKWLKLVRELRNELQGEAIPFSAMTAADAESDALRYASRQTGPRDKVREINGKPEVLTLEDMRKRGYDGNALLRNVLLKGYGQKLRPEDPFPNWATKGKGAPANTVRFLVRPVRYNAQDIDKQIAAIDEMLAESKSKAGGVLPSEFNRLSEAAHSLRDRLGASGYLAAQRFTLPDGTEVTGHAAQMQQFAKLTGEVKQAVQQAGVPERSVGTPTASQLSASEQAGVRGRMKGAGQLDPDERTNLELVSRWSAPPGVAHEPVLPRMGELEQSAEGLGLKYPLPATVGAPERDALLSKLMGYGDPTRPSTNQALMDMAGRTGTAQRLRLMPGVHATNLLHELSRPRLRTGFTTSLGSRAYTGGALSEVGRQLRLDAALRAIEELSPGAIGAATVEPENEPRLPVMLQGIRSAF